eukprot:94314-Pyramimonas_sp.AAC.1
MYHSARPSVHRAVCTRSATRAMSATIHILHVLFAGAGGLLYLTEAVAEREHGNRFRIIRRVWLEHLEL